LEERPESFANLRNLLLGKNVVDSRAIAVLVPRLSQLDKANLAVLKLLQ